MRCDHAAERRQVTFSTVSTTPGFMHLTLAETMLPLSNAGCFDGPYGHAIAMESSVAIGIAPHGAQPPRHAGRIIGLRVWGARMFAEARQPTGRLRCTTIRACRSEGAAHAADPRATTRRRNAFNPPTDGNRSRER